MSSREKKLVEKQRRHLKVLLHAATCQNEEEGSPCPISSHCVKMKQLWKHISTCGNKNCTYKYCRTSRQLLSHRSHCIKFNRQLGSPLKLSKNICQNVSSSPIKSLMNRNRSTPYTKPQTTSNTRINYPSPRRHCHLDEPSIFSNHNNNNNNNIPEEHKEDRETIRSTSSTSSLNSMVVVGIQIDRLDIREEGEGGHQKHFRTPYFSSSSLTQNLEI